MKIAAGATMLAGAMLALICPAANAATCTSAAPTVTVTLSSAETATLGTSLGTITLNSVACTGSPTVSNTDTINVNATTGNETLVVDLTNGPFAPGLTPEGTGDSEIEINANMGTGSSDRVTVTGSSAADQLLIGASGIKLNGDDDLDVVPSGTELFTLNGADGNDQLRAGGDSATDGPLALPATLNGDAGDDTLEPGLGSDTAAGGVGTDTVDYSAAIGGVTLNLQSNSVTGSGPTDTLSQVENAIGTPYDDTLTGNTLANSLRAGDANDTVVGAGGDDHLDGDAGVDRVNFSAATNPLTVDLAAGRASGQGEDTLSEIENVTGGAGSDRLTGDGESNIIQGDDGIDRINGGGGDDALDGEDGFDTVDFSGSNRAVTVSLAAEQARGQGLDTVTDFDAVIGSRGNDVLRGDATENVLEGSDGNDRLRGGGDDDTLDGGAGKDAVDYSGFSPVALDRGVSVDLTRGRASGEGIDDLSGVENVIGSASDDVLRGSGVANKLNAGPGDDSPKGRGARDRLLGGDGDDRLSPGGARDRASAGTGDDSLFARDGRRDRLSGGGGRDTAKVDRVDRVRGVQQIGYGVAASSHG